MSIIKETDKLKRTANNLRSLIKQSEVLSGSFHIDKNVVCMQHHSSNKHGYLIKLYYPPYQPNIVYVCDRRASSKTGRPSQDGSLLRPPQ